MNFILLILAILYLFCTAFSGYRAIKKLDTFPIPEAQRIHRYRFSLGWNLCSLLFVFIIVWSSPITFLEIGFRSPVFSGAHPILYRAVLIVCCQLTALFLYQILTFLISPSYRKNTAESLQQRFQAGGQYEKAVDSLIPRTSREKRWFFLTSLAAGVCEETVFRGFCFYLLQAVLPLEPILTSIVVGFSFGFAHFYQGAKGIFKTALLGTLFGLLFSATDSLFFCIPLHFLFDFSSAFLYSQEQ